MPTSHGSGTIGLNGMDDSFDDPSNFDTHSADNRSEPHGTSDLDFCFCHSFLLWSIRIYELKGILGPSRLNLSLELAEHL